MNYSLMAVTRQSRGDKTRENGKIPGVVYGGGLASESIAVNYGEFNKLYRAAGVSSLIDLQLNEKKAGIVLVQDIQHDPVSNRILHIDLRRIDMTKPMTATVELRFSGEAPIIKASGGTLVTTVTAVEVKCLPEKLVSHLSVDVSNLTTYDVVVKVKDLTVPEGVQIINPKPDDLVVKAAPALTEEQIKAMEEAGTGAVDLTKIEAAGKKKEAATEEGEAAAPAEEKKTE